jgi:pSer/pThr/pTyr-binding forkhead associated (FHA) protein
MPFCTNCGHDNPEGANFCSQCGTALRPAGPERPAESTGTIALSAIDADRGGERPEDTGELTDGEAAAVEALPAGNALLVVRRGPNAGSRFLLDTDVTTAGRHPDSDIFLDDVTVSRRHAEFRRAAMAGGNAFSVHDVGSLNGTYVNRDRIDDAPLSSGDEVQVGKYRLVFYASPLESRPETRADVR